MDILFTSSAAGSMSQRKNAAHDFRSSFSAGPQKRQRPKPLEEVMQNSHESLSFDRKHWACVTVQSPFGPVTIARRLPTQTQQLARATADFSTIRRLDLSSPSNSAAKRVRSRRSL